MFNIPCVVNCKSSYPANLIDLLCNIYIHGHFDVIYIECTLNSAFRSRFCRRITKPKTTNRLPATENRPPTHHQVLHRPTEHRSPTTNPPTGLQPTHQRPTTDHRPPY